MVQPSGKQYPKPAPTYRDTIPKTMTHLHETMQMKDPLKEDSVSTSIISQLLRSVFSQGVTGVTIRLRHLSLCHPGSC